MNKLNEYALLKARIKDLEDQCREMEPDIRAELLKAPDGKIKEDWGTFYVTKTPVYEFSDAIKKMEEELKKKADLFKAEKELEIQKDKAVLVEVKEKVTFRPAKMALPAGVYQWPKLDEKQS